jgi:hypothetical protein
MSRWFLTTLETVTTETPRSRAMSFMRTAMCQPEWDFRCKRLVASLEPEPPLYGESVWITPACTNFLDSGRRDPVSPRLRPHAARTIIAPQWVYYQKVRSRTAFAPARFDSVRRILQAGQLTASHSKCTMSFAKANYHIFKLSSNDDSEPASLSRATLCSGTWRV